MIEEDLEQFCTYTNFADNAFTVRLAAKRGMKKASNSDQYHARQKEFEGGGETGGEPNAKTLPEGTCRWGFGAGRQQSSLASSAFHIRLGPFLT